MKDIHTKEVEPNLVGTNGKAWKVDVETVLMRCGLPASAKAVNVASWIVYAPYAHPIWSHYLIGAIALGDIPGCPPARVGLEGATHEVYVYALDPSKPYTINGRPALLTPVNFVGQFIEASDEAATARITQVVQDVIDAKLNPDTDAMGQWIARFSASNLKKMPMTTPAITPGGAVILGTGASDMLALNEMLMTSTTLSADETKPQ